jgi:hypothetical protein
MSHFCSSFFRQKPDRASERLIDYIEIEKLVSTPFAALARSAFRIRASHENTVTKELLDGLNDRSINCKDELLTTKK